MAWIIVLFLQPVSQTTQMLTIQFQILNHLLPYFHLAQPRLKFPLGTDNVTSTYSTAAKKLPFGQN